MKDTPPKDMTKERLLVEYANLQGHLQLRDNYIAELEGALEKIRDLPYEGSNNETYGGIAEQALPKCKTCGGSGVVLADKSKPYTCEACPDCEKDGVVWVDPIFHKPIAAPKKCKRCNGTGVVPQERFSGNKPCPDCPDKQ